MHAYIHSYALILLVKPLNQWLDVLDWISQTPQGKEVYSLQKIFLPYTNLLWVVTYLICHHFSEA